MKFNADLVYQVVRTKQLNKRRAIASTKDRAQVAGGGKKPWPQKGTGRARAGSNRSPLWKGGGITFGPNASRSYAGKVTQKMGKLALAMVLQKKQEDKEVILCDSIAVDQPKTKLFAQWLRSQVSTGSCLVVSDDHSQILSRAARNIPGVKTSDVANVDILDVLKYKYVVITKPGLKSLEARLKNRTKRPTTNDLQQVSKEAKNASSPSVVSRRS